MDIIQWIDIIVEFDGTIILQHWNQSKDKEYKDIFWKVWVKEGFQKKLFNTFLPEF